MGSAVLRRLELLGYTNILTATRDQLDLRDQAAVSYWFRANRPEFVYLVAGTVGGIMANSTRPAEFIYDNMMIHATVVHSAHLFGAKKLLVPPHSARDNISVDVMSEKIMILSNI